jgi:hypothetical protein
LQPPSSLPSLCDRYRPFTLAEESIQKKEKAKKSIFIYGTTFKKNKSGSDFQRIQIWNDRSQKQKKNYGRHPFKVPDLFLFAIRRFSHSHGYTDEFKVTGYTTFKVNNTSSEKTVTYYATEYMNGKKRYDYTIIDFLSDDSLSATCPLMILGFLRYDITLGIPTPHFSDERTITAHHTRSYGCR